jgi:small redox-active disulfide protein 2
MEIKVLGPGCANCTKLYELAEEAVGKLGLDVQVQKVSDILEITRSGIMSTPGFVINGKVVHTGKPVPTVEKVMDLIKQEM